MPAPKGNNFYLKRTKFKEKLFETPEILFEAACEYFKHCDDNPWIKNEPVKSGDMAGQCMQVETSRPYTLSGLCIFLGCSQDTLSNYGGAKGYEEYFGVVKEIKEIVYTQKFEGASVGVFNANIIARDLGLSDNVKQTGSVVSYNAEVSKEEAKNISDALENEY